MKIAVLGISEIILGKQMLTDERLDRLKELLRPPKVTHLEVEIVDQIHLKDAEAIICKEGQKLDLIVEDLDFIEDRLSKEIPAAESELFSRCQRELEKDNLLSELNFSDEEKNILANFVLVTLKPTLLIKPEESAPIPLLLRQGFAILGMFAFFTANEKELRAWAIKKGTTAWEAAGLIHSDIQRGFIKAEVLAYQDIIKSGGVSQAKAQNLLKLEDKGYVVKDGDLIKFRFNV